MPTERHLWNRFSSTVLLVAVALLVPTPLRATLQQDQRLSWAEAVREAVDWHPSVTEAVARLNARTEEVTIAEAGYRPQLSGGIGSGRSEEHTSELQSLMRISYAVFCLKKKNKQIIYIH